MNLPGSERPAECYCQHGSKNSVQRSSENSRSAEKMKYLIKNWLMC